MFIREDSGDVAVLRLAHKKVSALTAEFCEALVVEIAGIAASPSTALVVTGTGSAFSAGVDLFKVLDGGAAYLERFLPAMGGVLPDATDVSETGGGCGERARDCRRLHHRSCVRSPRDGGWDGSNRRARADGGGPDSSLPLEIVGARVPASPVLRQSVLTGRTRQSRRGA